jgi:DNA (cytosine-5)-methyltransferase 1
MNRLKEITKGNSQGYRVYDPCGVSVTLSSCGGGAGAKTGLYIVKVKNQTKEGYIECPIGG